MALRYRIYIPQFVLTFHFDVFSQLIINNLIIRFYLAGLSHQEEMSEMQCDLF